jgi:hypothetical protein
MKLLMEPIEVRKKGAYPKIVIWRDQRYQVHRIEERWLWHGRWWTTPSLRGECRRYFKLVAISPGGNRVTMEVFEAKADWVLSQLDD